MKTFNLPDFEKSIYEKMENFIVIGSFDGFSHDNFFPMVSGKEKKNNKIIFVEPIKKYYDALLNNVKALEGFDVVTHNLGVSDKSEVVTMVAVKPNLLEKYGWFIEGCACVVENGTPINIYMKDVQEEDLEYSEIKCVTFNELLALNGLATIDFVQVDTEGYDERIVGTIDFETAKIKFLKFEKHYLSPGFIETVKEKLEKLNYLMYWDNDNYYFVDGAVIDS